MQYKDGIHLLQLKRTVLPDLPDRGEGMVFDAVVTQELTALGESFLHEEAHSRYLRTGLTA